MLPSRRNKIDLGKLTPEERKQLYGQVPLGPQRRLIPDRKYFDSGDYALSKAGRAPQSMVGTAIPNPENIPHASSPGNGHSNGHQVFSISPTNSTSPVNRESRLAHNENTEVPKDKQLPEGTVNKEDTEFPDDKQVPQSAPESVSVEDTAAVADSENTETT